MIREGYVRANDLTFHYAAAGDPDAPLCLFLHGFPDYWAGWRPSLEALADRFHCVAPDQRGYNLSDKPSSVEAYRPKHLIADVLSFARHFAPGQRFRLIAHDWGGAIAWAYALKHPETLEKLAICNAVHPAVFQREVARNPDQQKASQYILAHREPDAEARIIANDYADLSQGFAALAAKGLLSADDAAAYRAAWSQPGALTGMLNWYRAMRIEPPRVEGAGAAPGAATTPYDPATMIVRVPTLVVWGLEDTALLPGCVEGLDAFVPDLTLITVPDAGHFITLERPDLVARELRAFL